MRQYKDLKYVEQAFRTMKTTDINIRPTRVYTERHVRGFIFRCFLAYSATWEIRNRLSSVLERKDSGECEAGSLQEIFRNLSQVSLGILEIAGKDHVQLSKISKENNHIFDLLNLPPISSIIGNFKEM